MNRFKEKFKNIHVGSDKFSSKNGLRRSLNGWFLQKIEKK